MEAVKNEYKYFIYPGNHPEVIRQSLQRRNNMTELPSNTSEERIFSEANLIWRPIAYPKKLLTTLNNTNRTQPLVSFLC